MFLHGTNKITNMTNIMYFQQARSVRARTIRGELDVHHIFGKAFRGLFYLCRVLRDKKEGSFVPIINKN